MNSISKFHSEPFIDALKAFFEELKVPVDYLADEPASANDILGDRFKATNEAHKLIEDVYALGMVNDAIFEGTETFKNLAQVKKLKADYDGLLLFGVTLKSRKDGLPITRSHLAEITRAFNLTFPYTPVTIIFKYGSLISFANSERIPYKQEWREGEKIGKVSLLKDIDTTQPHRGHLAILKQLVIPTTGSKAVKSFTQLYSYWQSVFSISVLNKNFYEDIIAWFNKAVKDIKIPDQTAGSEKHKDFTVRLIARLIFIWFLKELKVVKDDLLLPEFENGEENDLIKPKSKGTGYYKFILQNLFFNALNSEKKDRDKKVFDVYAANFTDEKSIKEAIFFSPYLNGGLFDIHPNDWCELGKVNNAFAVPDTLFLDKEKGLNSILARYKFTIAENTPLEEEIAVDPEMLGRIFENLLAEQSDDTKEAARKNAGAFYTPRPVVSYMCRSTLLKHLDTEIKPENSKAIIKKLLETTVLDPACGSGAFPMGMLEEMMQVLTTVDPEGKVWVAEMMKSKDDEFRNHISEMFADGQIRYVKKLGLLRSCLFGVDLLEYAIEITKLRCWLSLIVEQRVDFSKENYNLKPLPNLEFKFYKKNSLLRFYKDQNINQLIDKIDNEKLLNELVNLENQYFIAKSDRHGTKEEIKGKIIKLLEKIVDSKSDAIMKELNAAQNIVNYLVSNRAPTTEINKAKKKVESLSNELGELAVFRNSIKDYFIERVVFPGIFNKESKNPGFDIVIGNPPYVNTKLISKMGLTKKLEEEYGFCDDLYNHFTFRGLELLKNGGILSYITSDTFLVIMTKENMRRLFIGAGNKDGQIQFEEERLCKLLEIVNTPKAFAAMVDTAIFTLAKVKPTPKDQMNYIDLRFPKAETFGISEAEWESIKKSSENLAGWEKVLNTAFGELGRDGSKEIKWVDSHTCDDRTVLIDEHSKLTKYRTDLFLYHNSLNYSIFPPSKYNSDLFDKIVKPVWPTFKQWWPKVETSRKLEHNRNEIGKYLSKLKPKDYTFLGVLADGGVGLQTGDNGKLVGIIKGSKPTDSVIEARPKKLLKAIEDEPKIKKYFPQLKGLSSLDDTKEHLAELKEAEIRELFDSIKERFGSRILGKGFIYRIVSTKEIKEIESMSDVEKENGIKSEKEVFVRYDKGDRDGNKWLSDTPFVINWNKESVAWLKDNSGKSGTGMPVVRNPQFYFKSGFSWNCINGTRNTNSFRFKFIYPSVNDVQGMKLSLNPAASHLLSEKYIVCMNNSYLVNRLSEAFINFTVAFQINDTRQIPIIIPTKEELKAFEKKYDQCFAIQEEYFAGEIDKTEARNQLRPIEAKIDEMVNKLYGIEAKEEIILDELEEEVLITEETEEDED
ncbi:MAG: N-6 DNA methylase [Bacteroidetes bacterium]|nr:N-6 DNA methylase [Bacteroidota bacterium]